MDKKIDKTGDGKKLTEYSLPKVGILKGGMFPGAIQRTANSMGAANVSMGPTFFYTPELTPDSWLLPKSRQEVIKWCRIFYNLEPYSACPGASLLTESGLKNVEDITQSDLLFSGLSGTPESIKEIHIHDYDGPLYEFKAKFQNIFLNKWTENHPILVARGKDCPYVPKDSNVLSCQYHGKRCKTHTDDPIKPEWIRAEHVKENDWVLIPKFNFKTKETRIDLANYVNESMGLKVTGEKIIINSHGPSEKNRFIEYTTELFELIGWYLSEGCIQNISRTEQENTVLFSVHDKERNICERLATITKKLFDANSIMQERPESHSLTLRVNSVILTQFLLKSCNHGAGNKIIPSFVWGAPKECIEALIKAYFAGDGCEQHVKTVVTSKENKKYAGVNHSSYAFTISKSLALGMQYLFTSLDILPSITQTQYAGKRKIKGQNGKSIDCDISDGYSIRLTGHQLKKLYPEKELVLKKDIKKYHEDENFFYVRVESIKKTSYKGKVYNFETPDNTYLAPFCVHNCQSIINMHSKYPFSTFTLKCNDVAAQKIYNDAFFSYEFDWYDFMLQCSLSYWKFGECLSGDTKIPLLDGTESTIEDLYKQNKSNFYVYSIDDKGKLVPGLVEKVVFNGIREDILEVVLDNGEVIKCTTDHKFLLRDGSYKEAKDLVQNDSLMPLYRRPSSKSDGDGLDDYELVYVPGENRWRFTHRAFIGSVPKGNVVHHKDFNKHNNIPVNLEAMNYKVHRDLHVSLASDPEALNRLWKGNQKYWDKIENRKAQGERASHPSPETRKKLSVAGKRPKDYEKIKKALKVWYSNGGEQILSEALKKRWQDSSYRERVLESRKIYQNSLSKEQRKAFAEKVRSTWTPERKAINKERCKNISEETRKKLQEASARRWNKEGSREVQSQKLKEVRENKFWNHKVKEVRKGNSCGVYDLINVNPTNNFAISAGVFVHNCLAWGNWNAAKKKWDSFICLDPDLVEIKQNPLSGKTSYELIPTVEIKKMVRDAIINKNDSVPDVVINSVINNKRIPLDGEGTPIDNPEGHAYEPARIFTLARITDPGSVRGTPPLQCFAADTKIALLNGTNPTIGELYKNNVTNFGVYSFNEEGDFIPSIASKVILNGKKKTVKVYLDNNDFIQCTPDHLFLLRNGTWSEAQNLKAGDSLMPLHRKTSSLKEGDSLGGYEKVYIPKLNKYIYTHRLAGKYFGELHRGQVVHHKNFQKKDNSFENLEIVDKILHVKLHQELIKKARLTPGFNNKISKGLNEYWGNKEKSKDQRELLSNQRLENWKDPKYREKMQKVIDGDPRKDAARKAIQSPDVRKKMSEGTQRALANGLPERIGKGVKKAWQRESYRKHLIEVRQSASFRKQASNFVSNYMKDKYPKLKEVETLLNIFLKDTSSDTIKFRGNNSDRLRIYSYAHRRNLPIKIAEREGFIYLQKTLNHKVVNVIEAEEVDVYDIESVKDTHTFCAVTNDGSGAVVHNCLFKTLILQDKLRLAQIAIADRHHLPIELWTVGHLTGDPTTTILPDENTLNNIREMIRSATQTPPFCLTEDTRVLTEEGFKYHKELKKMDKVATFNPKTEEIEYHIPDGIYIFDYEGEMIHFKTQKLDHMVTPNHRCWVQEETGDWKIVEAKDVKINSKFRTYFDNKLAIIVLDEQPKKVQYKGKVWCVGVPNHLFVCERNGEVCVTGNTIVYSPLLKYEALSVSGKLLSIYEDLGFIENQILVGLGVNKNLILGEGPSFSNVKTVALHRLIMEYQTIRDLFTNFMKKNIFLPVAIANNLKDKDGRWIVPEVKWAKSLNSELEKEDLDRYFKFWKEGLISTKTLFTKMPDELVCEYESKELLGEIGGVFDKSDKRLPKPGQVQTGAKPAVKPEIAPGVPAERESLSKRIEEKEKEPTLLPAPKKEESNALGILPQESTPMPMGEGIVPTTSPEKGSV